MRTSCPTRPGSLSGREAPAHAREVRSFVDRGHVRAQLEPDVIGAEGESALPVGEVAPIPRSRAEARHRVRDVHGITAVEPGRIAEIGPQALPAGPEQ